MIKIIEDYLNEKFDYENEYNKIKEKYEKLTSDLTDVVINMIFSNFYNHTEEYIHPNKNKNFFTDIHETAEDIYFKIINIYNFCDSQHYLNDIIDTKSDDTNYFIECAKIHNKYNEKINKIFRNYELIILNVDENFKTGDKAAKWLKEEFNFDVM